MQMQRQRPGRWPSALVSMVLMTAPVLAHAQQTTAVAEGARVYGDACGMCHNARSPLERTDRQWVTIVNHMRVRGNLTGKQARAVLAFLQGTNTDPRERIQLPNMSSPLNGTQRELSDDVPTNPRLIEQGAVLATDKACVGCHVIGNIGGAVGPSLDNVVDKKGARFVRQKLADPTVDNRNSMMPNFGLTDLQIDALVAYLATLNRTVPK